MPSRSVLRPILAIAAASLALAACARPDNAAGSRHADQPGATPTSNVNAAKLVPPGYNGRFRVVATVLQSPAHGPQLCQAVATSLPPQCGGPDIVGWDWDTVEHESANGTLWGEFMVTGTWDAAKGRFALTERAIKGDQAPASERPSQPEPDFSSPCPTPAGGWRPLDPSKASNEALDRALAAAQAESDFAGAWLDQSYLRQPGTSQSDANDPKRFVLNLRFTGDLDRHHAQITAIWGGALCLSRAAHTLAELETIRTDVTGQFGQLSSSLNELTGAVEVTLIVATQAAQAQLDTAYGPGVVRLSSWLRPID